MSRRAFARASEPSRSASATHDGCEHHDERSVLRLEPAVLVEPGLRRAVDRRLLVRRDLADAGREGRGEGSVERLVRARGAGRSSLEEDRGRFLAVRAPRKEDERRVDSVEVPERVESKLERLAPQELGPLRRSSSRRSSSSVPSPQRLYWTVLRASIVAMSLASARPAVVSGRTAIARTAWAVAPSSVPMGGPWYVTATRASPLGRRYGLLTCSAICAARCSAVPDGSHADQAGAGAGLPRPTRTSSVPTPAPATTASRT